MVHGFWWDHPGSPLLRELAVNVDPADGEIHRDSISEAELPLQVDLDERTEVGLLRLVELIPPVSAGVLAIQEHVVGLSDDLRESDAIWVFDLQTPGDDTEFFIGEVT